MKAEVRTSWHYGTRFEVWRPIEYFKDLEQAIQHCAEEGYELDEKLVTHLRTVYTIEPEEDEEYVTRF